jgi:PKD repeat protein
MIAKNQVKYYFIPLLFSFSTLIGKSQLKADFNADQVSGCAPLLVNFTDSSTGNPTQWEWNLGNGTTSFLKNPSVTYFNPGQYTIKLVVKNATGADSLIKTQYITVNAIPTVEFEGDPLAGCFPLKVQFNDLSNPGSGIINLWQWDFGDGTIGTDQNPSHTYKNSGNFNVTLQVRNSLGCIKTMVKPSYVKVGAGVTANFSNDSSNNCKPPAIINFKNLSTAGPDILTYKWDFGDGSTSTQANPSHNYTTPGSFTVQLITTSSSGCTNTIIKNKAVQIGSVIASFSGNSSVCANAPLSLSSTSFPVPKSVLWKFGDGDTSTSVNPVKVFVKPGVYTVTLIYIFRKLC